VSAPFEPLRGDVPRVSTSVALAQRDPGETVPPTTQWAMRLLTGYSDLAVDGDGRLLGRPRDAVGFVGRVDAESLAQWASATIPRWQHRDMAPEDWGEVARLLAEWGTARDATAVADTPHDARVHAQLTEDRARAARRAELAEQQATAAAELERLDRGEPVNAEPRRAGWLRRAPT